METFTEFETLKQGYGIGLRNALNNVNVITREVARNRMRFEGEESVWSLHTGRTGAVGSRKMLGTLPTPRGQKYNKLREGTTTLPGTIKIPRELIEASKTDRSAFISEMDKEVRGMEKDLKHNWSRQHFGTGRADAGDATIVRTGVIANVNGVPAGNEITLDQEAKGAAIAISRPEMRAFYDGMRIDAIDPATGAVVEGDMEVVGVDLAAGTITVDDMGATADGNWICVQGAFDSEVLGLRVLINDGPGDQWDGATHAKVHGKSVDDASVHQSIFVGGDGVAVDEDLFDEAFDVAETEGAAGEAADEDNWLVLGSYEVRRELQAQMQQFKRYTVREATSPTVGTRGGTAGLQLTRGQFIADKFNPTQDFFAIDREELVLQELAEPQWDDQDGKTFFKTSTQLAYEARYFLMASICVAVRNAHVRGRVAAP